MDNLKSKLSLEDLGLEFELDWEFELKLVNYTGDLRML